MTPAASSLAAFGELSSVFPRAWDSRGGCRGSEILLEGMVRGLEGAVTEHYQRNIIGHLPPNTA